MQAPLGGENSKTAGAGRPARFRNKAEGSLGWIFWFVFFWIFVFVFKFTPAAGVVVFATGFLDAVLGR